MSTYLIKPSIPAGTSFDGQIVFDLTNYEIPYSWWRYVDSVEIVHRPKWLNRYTGFETTKRRIGTTGSSGTMVDLSITWVGSLPRDVLQRLQRLAEGANGGGIDLLFYDDLVSGYTYTGKWDNAGDFVENNPIHGGASVRLACWSATVIS